MFLPYNTFISTVLAKGLRIQYRDESEESFKSYYIFTYDGNILYETQANGDDALDFEAKYKSSANKKLYPLESLTNWIKTRPRRMAGDLYINFVYFVTGDVTKFDNGGDTNFSVGVAQNGKSTWVDFCPSFDYEIGGGGVTFLSSSGACKMSFIAAPDYPPQYGGSVVFVRNKRMGSSFQSFVIGEVDPKLFRYNAQLPGVNKVRLLITHEESDRFEFEYYLDLSVNL